MPLSTPKRYRTYLRWKKWLGTIRNEITAMIVYRHVYREVGAIVRANPKLRSPSSFYDWMHQSYTQVMVITICRVVDGRDDVVSLTRLMREIERHPEVLSRRRFVGRYPSHLKSFGDHDFDHFAPAGSAHINPRIIARQRKLLLKSAQRIRKFRHKHVAHRADRSLRRLPTFEELNKCADLLEDLLKKYVLLIETQCLTQVLPVWQYDWKKIFRTVWIEGSTR